MISLAALTVVVSVALYPNSRNYLLWLVTSQKDVVSDCYGTVGSGRLAYGVHLPFWGENYRAYHWTGWLVGRANAHTKIRTVLQKSYASLARSHPELKYTYGEISWPWGGRLWPHVTHRNGEAVDFFVPVRDVSTNRSIHFPTSVFNKLGYNFEFDTKGRAREFRIDFDAMAAHLIALDIAARAEGTPIRRVILAPELQPFLFTAEQGAKVRRRLTFSKRRSWVRHDEHYHVDFDLPCKKR